MTRGATFLSFPRFRRLSIGARGQEEERISRGIVVVKDVVSYEKKHHYLSLFTVYVIRLRVTSVIENKSIVSSHIVLWP